MGNELLGNYEGIGDQRQNEVKQSCATLGIAEERCVALNNPDLQDNPKKWWNEDVVEDVLKTHLKKWNIDLVSAEFSLFLAFFIFFLFCLIFIS